MLWHAPNNIKVTWGDDRQCACSVIFCTCWAWINSIALVGQWWTPLCSTWCSNLFQTSSERAVVGRITDVSFPFLVSFTPYPSMYILLSLAGWSLGWLTPETYSSFFEVTIFLSQVWDSHPPQESLRTLFELLYVVTSLRAVHVIWQCTASNPLVLIGPASWAQSSASLGAARLSAWASLFLAHMFY